MKKKYLPGERVYYIEDVNFETPLRIQCEVGNNYEVYFEANRKSSLIIHQSELMKKGDKLPTPPSEFETYYDEHI